MTNKLYILCGIPFSGKTTIAKRMAEKLGFVRIDLDEVKFDLFNPQILDTQIDQSGWDKIFEEMYRRIRQSLVDGKTVIHDTGNFTRHERRKVQAIAKELGVETLTIFVNIPPEVAHQRLLDNRITKTRFDVADEDFQSTVKELEPPDENEKHLVFNWTDDVELWLEKYISTV